MKHLLCVALLLALAACKEDAVQDTSALPLTEDVVGHFCQMNLSEHEGPKAQVHLAGLPQMPLYFGQVRDVVAYKRLPEQSHDILAIWVNDMGAPGATWSDPGAENWISATDALFVVGSRATGGMGALEIVPFSDRSKANAFVKINGGQVMGLEDIPDAAVLAPDDLNRDNDDADFNKRLRELSRNSEG